MENISYFKILMFYSALAILVLGHSLYLLITWKLARGLQRLKSKQSGTINLSKFPLVSVLISVRNEEEVIESCLQGLLQQDYPKNRTEIIFIDDRSTDSTAAILSQYKAEYPHLIKVLAIKKVAPGLSPKKNALKKGFAISRGSLILSTDADCIFNHKWMSTVVSNFDESTGIVLGLSTHYSVTEMNQFLWGWQALEFFSHSVVSSALIANGFPINATANNMAYLRKAFEQTDGFASHQHIISGDDDFLMQKIHALNKWKIKFAMQSESRVQTRPCVNLKQVWEQRKRWASKTSLYGKQQVVFLSFIYLYYSLILVSLTAGLGSFPFLYLGVGSWALKSLMDYSVMRLGAKIFHQEKLLDWFLPAAVMHMPLIVLAVIFGTFGRFAWKGQVVSKKVRK